MHVEAKFHKAKQKDMINEIYQKNLKYVAHIAHSMRSVLVLIDEPKSAL